MSVMTEPKKRTTSKNQSGSTPSKAVAVMR